MSAPGTGATASAPELAMNSYVMGAKSRSMGRPMLNDAIVIALLLAVLVLVDHLLRRPSATQEEDDDDGIQPPDPPICADARLRDDVYSYCRHPRGHDGEHRWMS